MGQMLRIRAFAALLGCLAVLASGVMTVAAAGVSASPPATERSVLGAPCSHCDECDGATCPVPTATCLQACVGVAPSLAVTAIFLPTPSVAGEAFRPIRLALLIGLSPPPDLFPPRT